MLILSFCFFPQCSAEIHTSTLSLHDWNRELEVAFTDVTLWNLRERQFLAVAVPFALGQLGKTISECAKVRISCRLVSLMGVGVLVI
jgi:hypothetical protein